VYGEDNYVAVRPGRFATNTYRYKGQIQSGQVMLFGGDFVNDCTTGKDMGGVSGSLLVNGPKDGQKKVYVKPMGNRGDRISETLANPSTHYSVMSTDRKSSPPKGLLRSWQMR
jgi:hypothetical protein